MQFTDKRSQSPDPLNNEALQCDCPVSFGKLRLSVNQVTGSTNFLFQCCGEFKCAVNLGQNSASNSSDVNIVVMNLTL